MPKRALQAEKSKNRDVRSKSGFLGTPLAMAKAVRTFLIAETLAVDCFSREQEGKLSFFLMTDDR
ncbi:MAG: hypothetical protein EAZ60_02870 [Oscillatoriales cyanobacterium]|nr:MAG: hypothetical protein EAZ83_12830 [Oscillatoriales cyanobacterium]TAF00179.1 MAG: hypothetical protein EAZ79_03905 [Oscillatoriales cyanobacterium]TAF19741.1 MAG: hypothetical protein EAZ73_14505 [Oscillatoriales cyanobacterium]TAF39132.1 MAG: hypothetical protein EAZ69_02280 [Oscillatoriales cyanobacterium]TAF58504.1 MAG: hypothetical protein EAZ60_02870 [Oscillatoriales cyanobacterium]